MDLGTVRWALLYPPGVSVRGERASSADGHWLYEELGGSSIKLTPPGAIRLVLRDANANALSGVWLTGGIPVVYRHHYVDDWGHGPHGISAIVFGVIEDNQARLWAMTEERPRPHNCPDELVDPTALSGFVEAR